VNLYLRLLKLLFLLPFVRRRVLLDSGHITFRVWPTDCDINLHLNNGRYLTFMDLGRTHLLAQIGLLGKLLQHRWTPVLTAAEINYLRPIQPFQKFDLSTRLLTWDDKYYYMEQRFVAGGQLRAVALVKGLFLHRGKPVKNRAILAALNLDSTAPDMPEVVRLWNGLAVLKKQHLN